MTATLDEEREALKQIKKILEDLGEDSLIGAAFNGVAMMYAENNIGNGIALTVQSCIDLRDKKIEELEDTIRVQRETNERLSKVLGIKNDTIADAEKSIEIQRGTIADLKKEVERLNKITDKLGRMLHDANDKLNAADEQIEELGAGVENNDKMLRDLNEQCARYKSSSEYYKEQLTKRGKDIATFYAPEGEGKNRYVETHQILDRLQDYLSGRDEELGNDLQTALDRMAEDDFDIEMDGAKAARQICKIQRQINEANILLEQVSEVLMEMDGV